VTCVCVCVCVCVCLCVCVCVCCHGVSSSLVLSFPHEVCVVMVRRVCARARWACPQSTTSVVGVDGHISLGVEGAGPSGFSGFIEAGKRAGLPAAQTTQQRPSTRAHCRAEMAHQRRCAVKERL